ncbi:MAG: class I SAM-dependent methyltransferase, partial [Pseudomonas sp.]
MVEQLADGGIRVEALTADYQAKAQAWAERLDLPLVDDNAGFAVQVGAGGLQIQQLGAQAPGPVRVDFVEGAAAHRRVFGGGSGQMIAKAVGIAQGVRPQVLDATAGLGKDAFVLASLGCQMTLIERQPLVAALLEDGLARAAGDAEVGPIVARMQLLTGNAIERMRNWQGEPPQVIYLDPM